MTLPRKQGTRTRSHRFSTFTSGTARDRSSALRQQTAAEMRAGSALFLVPKGHRPELPRGRRLPVMDGLVLGLAFAAIVALWVLL